MKKLILITLSLIAVSITAMAQNKPVEQPKTKSDAMYHAKQFNGVKGVKK